MIIPMTRDRLISQLQTQSQTLKKFLSKGLRINEEWLTTNKLIQIFEDPKVNSTDLESANTKSKELIKTLFKVDSRSSHLKSRDKGKNSSKDPSQPAKPKETFENMMKRLLDKGANGPDGGSSGNDMFKGDSMKLYNFFLNKLLTMSSDPFFNKKHQAYLLHTNMVSNGPSFYERMNNDIKSRRSKEDIQSIKASESSSRPSKMTNDK